MRRSDSYYKLDSLPVARDAVATSVNVVRVVSRSVHTNGEIVGRNPPRTVRRCRPTNRRR